MSALGLDHSNAADAAAKPLFLRQDAHVVWSGAEFQLSAPAADIFHPLSPAEALALLLLGQIGEISDVLRYLGRLGPAFPPALERVTHRYLSWNRNGTPLRSRLVGGEAAFRESSRKQAGSRASIHYLDGDARMQSPMSLLLLQDHSGPRRNAAPASGCDLIHSRRIANDRGDGTERDERPVSNRQ